MNLLALLKKEALTVRRNLGLFFVLLVVVPGALAVGTSVYEQTVPQDVPVGVAPADETTSETDLQLVRGSVQFFASPVAYDDRESAVRAIEREQVYVAFIVPGGLTDENASVTIEVVTDGSNAPLEDPAEVTLDVLEAQFDGAMPADVTFEQQRLGEERSLSAFLLPSALFGLVALYGMIYLPYQVREERRVMDRLRTETRLEYVAASKLVFYGALLVVPALTVSAASRYYGYGFDALTPGTVGVLALTFLFFAAVGLAVLFALSLRTAAIFVDLGLAIGALVLSGLVYPVGFYSELRREIARSLPTHYALVTLRGTMLRGLSLSVFSDYLAFIGVATVAALVALYLAIRRYDRGGVHE